MKSILYPGDIIMVKNQKFKDTNKLDTKLNGHPMLVLNNVNNIGDTIYCLHISSSFRTSLSHYYEINLSKKCYIDLKFIYKLECKNQTEVKHTITQKMFNEIIDKMTKLHESGTIRSRNEYIEYYDKFISKEKKRYNIERMVREIGAACDNARQIYKGYIASKNINERCNLEKEIELICQKAFELSKLLLDKPESTREEAFEALVEENYLTKRSCKTLNKITEKFDITQYSYEIGNVLTEDELKDYVENKINVIWQFALNIKDLQS